MRVRVSVKPASEDAAYMDDSLALKYFGFKRVLWG